MIEVYCPETNHWKLLANETSAVGDPQVETPAVGSNIFVRSGDYAENDSGDSYYEMIGFPDE